MIDASPVIDDLNVTPGPRNVSVTWSLLGNCTKVTSYQLTWTPSDAGGQMTVFSSFANITGLSPCQEYLLTVQPLEGTDNFGEPGNETIITENEEPQQPTDVQVLTVESKWDQLNLTWTQPPPPGPLCPITTNRISWSRADTGGSAGEEEIAAGSSYTITDLDPCAQYSVTIRAATEKGYGDGSEGNVGNTGTVAPAGPTNVTALMMENETTSLHVTWNQPTAPGPTCPILKNNITWSLDVGDILGRDEITANSSYTIIGLDPCTRYNVVVRAATEGGYGDQYGENSGNTAAEVNRCLLKFTEPQQPTDVQVLTVESKWDQLNLTWTQPPPPGPLCPITTNRISWSRADTGGSAGEEEIAAGSSYTITDLDPCAQYSVTIRAATEKGYGDGSEGNVGNTGTVVPAGPTNVTALMMENETTSLHVTWNQPTAPGPTCPILKNNITWSLSDVGDILGRDEITANSSYTIIGLDPCTRYNVVVRAATEGGYGDQYGENSGNTAAEVNRCLLKFTEPQQPTDVQVLTVESKWDQLNLTWTQPPPPGPLCPITTNRISWSRADTGGSAGEEEIAAGSSYTITDLDPCAQYSVTIRAATEKGYGDGSEGNVGNTGTASLGREYQRLADESEKAREPAQKQEVKQFILLLLSLYSEDMDTHNGTLCWKAVFGWLNDELSESKDSDDVTYNDRLELIIEKRAKHSASNVVMSNRERNMPLNTFSKIIEKALVLSCEKEFPLFLHLLVQVGGQKVNQELEVCRASPLHYAALKNNASAARYLVSHGASVEAKDRFGNTPAHYACMYGYKDLGDFLRTGQVNRCGLTAIDLLDGYKNYLKLYELDSESLLDIDMQKTNTGPQRTEALLNELKKKWQSDGIEKSVAKVHVNYTRGESHVIKDAVFNLVKSVQNSVANKNTVFSGELLMLGSSADNVRLFCPDEFDYNIVLSNLHGFGNGDLQVSLQEVGLSYTGCRTKINVSSNSQGIIPLLKGSNFLHTFYNLVKECIANFEPEDERIAIIPPGIKKTQVGVGLSLAWTGKEFPLLLVDVDIVPTMEAPWPADLPRPPLTPPHLKSVYINSIGNGEWRFSFAKAENEIMKNLTDDQRQVFLACKMVLSCLKVEKWAPREIQNRFKYFDKIFSKIPSPKGFVLKNTFFLELQEFKNNSYYWTDHSSKRIRTVFKRMCEKDTEEASKIEAYFAGGTQASCLGHGASEIVKFFTPKPGFHGVSVHRL
ncbi:uncharacterized protein [Penaeus vannamei]|uniref:uncharacterized protein n=1 Tax=Penaeus vannamei TaxID=6689 RepID=UPI00387F8F61